MAELFSLRCAVTENSDQLTKIHGFQKIKAEPSFLHLYMLKWDT